MKEEFENWLVTKDDKTENTAYSYKNAIPKLSKHYSDLKDKNIDLFYSNLKNLKEAEQLYNLEGNEAEFGSNSKGINRNAIVALIRFYQTFPIKSAREFYSKISEPDIEEAFNIVDASGINLHPIKKFAVINKSNGNSYPPKDIIRIIARNKQVSLDEDTLNGVEANAPFKGKEHMCKVINVLEKEIDLNKLIEQAINSDFIQMLSNESLFYFQKLLDVKDKFLNHSIPIVNLEKLLSNYKNYEVGTFEDFVDLYSGIDKEFLDVLGEFISYLDEKASGKVKWNKYSPSRTIAQAGVRQDNWVKHLLRYKIDSNHTPSGSIKNALNYAISPIENLTVLSENHRRKLSEFLFKEEYKKDTFTQHFISFFSPFEIEVKNQLNYSYLLSSIVYDKNIEPLWKPKTKKEEDIYDKYESYLQSSDWDGAKSIRYIKCVKEIIPKEYLNSKEENFNSKNFNPQYLEAILELTFKNFGERFKGKTFFQAFLKDLIETSKEEETMEIAEIFEQFRKFLDDERTDLAVSSRKTYLDNAIIHITSSYKAFHNKEISNININYNLIKQLSEVVENITGYTGIASFREFLKYLNKKYPKPKNVTLNKIYFGPPGTGKTFKIIEDYITNTETHVEKIDGSKQMIDLKRGFWHLAPGEGAYLWEDLKNDNYLGYEYCSHYLGDLSKVTKDEPSWDMKRRFSKVKVGDYFCIISGKKFYAIAKALHDYNPEISKNSNFDFQTIKVEWIKQFEKPELLNVSSLQAFSNLKGSKRWQSLLDALESQDIYPENKVGIEVQKNIKNYSLVSFHQSFSYEDFIEGIKPDLENEDDDENDIRYIIQDGIFKQSCDMAARLAGYEDLNSCIDDTKEGRLLNFQNAPPFHLLIDEINRGNISAIFGELITLIEKDKRLGNKYELMTDLPYSKREFGVPANLHIIGTMNTADRSVEALDTALRRRFSFVEVAPNIQVIINKHPTSGKIDDDLDLGVMLEKINNRIELLINKDHKIGHSYFLDVTSLKQLRKVFSDKVIPLLEEYFYGDYGKIGLVLGNQFIVKIEDKKKTEFADFNHEDKNLLREKAIYQFTSEKDWSLNSFISLYNPLILKKSEQE